MSTCNPFCFCEVDIFQKIHASDSKSYVFSTVSSFIKLVRKGPTCSHAYLSTLNDAMSKKVANATISNSDYFTRFLEIPNKLIKKR